MRVTRNLKVYKKKKKNRGDARKYANTYKIFKRKQNF